MAGFMIRRQPSKPRYVPVRAGQSEFGGVTLTGSEPAGVKVTAQADANVKKCVLELAGSDGMIVLDDADGLAAGRRSCAAITATRL